MFELIECFNQKKIIADLKKLLLREPKLAERKFPFIEDKLTVAELWYANRDGWCFGICANVVAHLESPMLKNQLIRIESCKEAFKSAMKQVESRPIEALLLQEMQRKALEMPEMKLYPSPPDMSGQFSMWCLEIHDSAQSQPQLHAILTSNNRALGKYLIFDSNCGLYESSKKFTQYLNNNLQRAMSQGMNQIYAMNEIIREAALTFASGVDNYSQKSLSFTNNIPRMSSKDLLNVARKLKAKISKYLPR
jgi:DNA gyrase/topoisomerase IV subunit B